MVIGPRFNSSYRISGYGTYETLSKPLQHFLDGLKAWHSSEVISLETCGTGIAVLKKHI